MNHLFSRTTLLLLATLTPVTALVGALLLSEPANNGIIPAPSNQAVYLTGEACTVNVAERTEASVMTDLQWCFAMFEHERIVSP